MGRVTHREMLNTELQLAVGLSEFVGTYRIVLALALPYEVLPLRVAGIYLHLQALKAYCKVLLTDYDSVILAVLMSSFLFQVSS